MIKKNLSLFVWFVIIVTTLANCPSPIDKVPEETTVPSPQPDPTPDVTPETTLEVTLEPTSETTPDVTFEPTPEPTSDITIEFTPDPTAEPTPDPTTESSSEPTAEPTSEPTAEPTVEPTTEPTAEPTAEPTFEPTAEPTTEPTTVPTLEPTPSPTPTPEITAVPGQAILLEAEDYTSFYDTTSGNSGNIYRTDDVDIEPCAEGGYNIGWIVSGEWLQYNFTITATDTFDIYLRLASAGEIAYGCTLRIDGAIVSSNITVPNTGAWQSWKDVVIEDKSIAAGSHTLKITFNGEFNFNFIYIVSSTSPPETTEPPGALPTSTPPAGYTSVVSQYGQLQVVGKDLYNEEGNPIRLKGMSTHGPQWFPIMKEHTIHNLVYDWGISVIRPAMYVEEYKNDEFWGGYLAEPDYMKGKVIEAIEDALDVGIYVLIDWHIHNDPTNFTSQAIAYYTEMAATYGGYPNVIYEICNEPEYVSWNTIKSYANAVIPVIRAIDPDNIILVGTANWCQDVDVAADSPLSGYSNIMYSLHFYAGSHGQSLRDKADYALSKGLPIFVSEWGTSDSTGGSNGNIYLSEAAAWVTWLNSTNRSWINWSFCNKAESSAALKPAVNIGGPWAAADLSQSGTYIKGLISAQDPTPAPTATPVPTLTPSPTPFF
ncbi:MAG: cellulase family glycosylhydrolase [Spirochaetales bacterium]|nr:cellulase family glycosylhydrolase [Spirochaetales bacterium]